MEEYHFNIKKINIVFAYILLFFSLFDAARNYTVLPLWFGYIKDFSLYMLLLLNIGKITIPKNLGICFYVWFLSVLFFSLLGFINAEYDRFKILIACIKYIEMFLVFFIMSNTNKIFGHNSEYFIKIYVYGSLALGLVNILGYMVDNPFVSPSLANENMPMGNYQGRITVGQPAIAIFPIILSFIYLFIKKKDYISYLLLNIYLIFIVLSTSNTGVVSIVAVLLACMLYCIFIKCKKRMFAMLVLYITVASTVLYYIVFIVDIYNIEYLKMYTNKILAIFGDSGDLQMNIRFQNWVTAISNMKGFDFLHGMGACGYYKYYEIQLIENTYVSTYVMYGFIGLFGMVMFWLRMTLYFGNKCINKKEGLLGLSICIIYMLHMVTLDLYMSYMLVFPLGLFINYAINEERK